jgi:hypothetical protein
MLLSLVIYAVFQILSVFLGNALFLFAYLIVFIIAIVVGILDVRYKTLNCFSWKNILYPFFLFFITNLILFLIYLPTIWYNPEINWKDKGEAEQDPMILQVFVPIVFCIFSFIVLFVTWCVTKITMKVADKELHTT